MHPIIYSQYFLFIYTYSQLCNCKMLLNKQMILSTFYKKNF